MLNLGKGRIHRLLAVLTVAGALTAGLYAQRGGQNAAPQAVRATTVDRAAPCARTTGR